MKSFANGLLKYLIALGVVGSAVFFAINSTPGFIATDDVNKAIHVTKIVDDTIKIACAADYPGGCLRRGGDYFFGQEIDILEKFLYKNDRIKFDFVNSDNIKNDIKAGLHDVGCGGWVYRSDGSIYSLPIIKGIKTCDIVKGNWTKEDPVFVQTATIFSEEAEDRYGSRCLKKYDNLHDCIQAYKNYMGPKRIILDSINFEYIQENDSLVFDSFTEHGDYGICLLCKDEQTKKDLDRRIAASMNSINSFNANIKSKSKLSKLQDSNSKKSNVIAQAVNPLVIPMKNNNFVNNAQMVPNVVQPKSLVQKPVQQMVADNQQQMIPSDQRQIQQQPMMVQPMVPNNQQPMVPSNNQQQIQQQPMVVQHIVPNNQQPMVPSNNQQQIQQQPMMLQPMAQQPMLAQTVTQPVAQVPSIDIAQVVKNEVQRAVNAQKDDKLNDKSKDVKSKSDKVDKKSNKVDQKSNKVDQKSDKADKKSDKADKKSDKADKKSDKADKKSDKADKKSDKTDKKSDNLGQSNKPKAPNDIKTRAPNDIKKPAKSGKPDLKVVPRSDGKLPSSPRPGVK